MPARGAYHTPDDVLEIDLPVDLPLVRADATLIEQAIGNLIANVVAHTPPQAHVAATASVTPDQVAIHVVDDGPGIASDALPRIFDKFVKAQRDSETDGGQGTGLGLAIAKGIMEAHGGTIAAESPVASGRGTRITLSFARKEPA
jgi:two-component system sensor histidine kinase KdpD